MSDDSTTQNEPPMIVDVVDATVINQWFDFWRRESNRRDTERIKAIEKIRRLALAGNSKAKRNNKAIAAVLADVFEGMAAEARSGKIKVRTFG